MVKAYIPIDKRQGKASIRGSWQSDKQGVCYDYLKRVNIEPCNLIYVKRHYKQEAVFYRDLKGGFRSKAYIWHNSEKIETLKRQSYFEFDRQRRGLKRFIKGLLQTYGGLTVYVRESSYLFEVWQ